MIVVRQADVAARQLIGENIKAVRIPFHGVLDELRTFRRGDLVEFQQRHPVYPWPQEIVPETTVTTTAAAGEGVIAKDVAVFEGQSAEFVVVGPVEGQLVTPFAWSVFGELPACKLEHEVGCFRGYYVGNVEGYFPGELVVEASELEHAAV